MLTRSADRLETALRGGVVDPGAAGDLDVARELQDLQHVLVSLGPEPAFVNGLYQRLLDEPAAEASAADAPSNIPDRPRVLTVGRRRGRGLRVAVAGVVGLLALAGVVGAAGRSSLPGQPLYAARQLLDEAGVALGVSEQGRGLRLLDVAERHIDDAVELASVQRRSPDDLRTALTDGWAATEEADQILVSDFAARTDPTSLTAIGAFAGRVLHATDGLAGSAPDVADAVTGFRAGVVTIRDDALRRLSACPVCGAATDEARQQLGTLTPAPGPASVTASTTATGPAALPTAPGTGSASPTASATPSGGASGTATAPSIPAGRPGSSTGGGSGSGSGTATPTSPVPPSQGPTQGSGQGSQRPTQSSSPSPSATEPVLPAPTSLLPTAPTLSPSPTLGVSASVTLPGVTTTVPLP